MGTRTSETATVSQHTNPFFQQEPPPLHSLRRFTNKDKRIWNEWPSSWNSRHHVATTRGWALFTEEWADSLARLLAGKRVLEVCAGRGTVLEMMRARGLDWTATDRYPVDECVLQMRALTAVQKVPHDVVFWSWMPYSTEMDRRIALRGEHCVFVGEDAGGCTGSTLLWPYGTSRRRYPYTIDPATTVDPSFVDVPRWSGINDQTWVLRPTEDKREP